MRLKIKTPAKVNLSLDVVGCRPDGYHDIESVMQTISLYDYLTFELTSADSLIINLSGNNPSIPYDKKNLVYRAIMAFYEMLPGLQPYKISVHIEKNIPTEAGMGGGSSNAAGAIWALNRLLQTNLTDAQINSLCAKLGSDLNVCYWGGTTLASSRGEKIKRLKDYKSSLCVIKPIGFGITAKQGYQMFDALGIKSMHSSLKLIKAIENAAKIESCLHNDLEIAPLREFQILQEIKTFYPGSIMTGSGSAYFVLKAALDKILPPDRFLTIQGLEFINTGITEA